MASQTAKYNKNFTRDIFFTVIWDIILIKGGFKIVSKFSSSL